MRASYTTLLLSVIALACGIALICSMDLVNGAVLKAFVEVIDTMAGKASLQIVAGEGGFFPEEVAPRIGGVPGVQLAVPVVSASAFTTDGSGELLTVHAIDITNDEAVRVYEARDRSGLELEDPLVVLSQPDSVVLTRSFADRHRLSVGDHIDLMTPAGIDRFTVRGLLEPSGIARVYGGNLVVMDVYAAEAKFTRPGLITRVDVIVSPGRETIEVAEAIRGALPEGLKVETPTQRKVDVSKIVSSLHVLLSAMSLVGLVVAFLISFNRLSTVFDRRTWQVGILRAVGARQGFVCTELVKESLLVGVAGVLLGIPLGLGLARLLLPIIANTTAVSYNLVAPEAHLRVDPGSIVVAASLGMAASLLAAVGPAMRTARLTVVGILSRRDDGSESRSKFVAYAGIVIAVTLSAAIAMQWLTGSSSWGLTATGFVAIATAWASWPLLEIGRCFLPAAARLKPSWRFASAMIAYNARRSSLTVATLGVGVGAVVWLWVVARSFEASVVDVLTSAFRADLTVSSARLESGAFEVPVHEDLMTKLKQVAGVSAVVGERVRDWHYGGGAVVIEAFDAEYFRTDRFGQWPLLDVSVPQPWQLVASGEGVVVSSNLVRQVGVRVGGVLEVETPRGPLRFTIVGVTSDFASPRGTVKLSREVYKEYWSDPQITLAFVNTFLPASNVRSEIARTLGQQYRLRILSSGDLVQQYATQIRQAFGAVDVLAMLVLVVILVGVSDALGASVFDRTRQFGMLRAIGARKGVVTGIVVTESIGLGILGSTLGLACGLVLGTLWVAQTFPNLLGWMIQLHIPYARIVGGVFVTVIVCMAAALLPAWQAAAIEPANALRYD